MLVMITVESNREAKPDRSSTQLGGWWFTLALGDGAGPNKGSLLLLSAGFVPLLVVFFVNLWGRPHYQFFPLALVGVAVLGWRTLQTTTRPLEAGRAGVGPMLIGASFCLLAAGVLVWSPWLAMIAALLGWTGICWQGGGWRLVRAMLPALVLAVTFLPPPLNLDAELMQSLRRTAVRWSSRVLDSWGVIHILSGNIVELPRQKLMVEEACSGINSFLLTLAAGLFYLLWRRRSAWRIGLILPCVLASVVLGNVGRITLGAWLQNRGTVNILSGWRHEVVGLILMGSYVGLIWSLDAFLAFLADPAPDTRVESDGQPVAEGQTAATPASGPPIATAGPGGASGWWWLVGGAFALLGVAALGRGWQHRYERAHQSNQMPEAIAASESALRAGATFTLPEQVGGWTRLQSESPLLHKVETVGVFSQIWKYQNADLLAAVAFDYPFRGYHDVTYCYKSAGWKMVKQERIDAGAEASPACMEVEMKQDPLGWGALWFSTVDERGRWLEIPVARPPSTAERLSIRERVGRWMGTLEQWYEPVGNDVTTYRMQTLVTDYTPMTASQRASTRELFETTRKLLAQQLMGQLQPKTPTPK